LSSTTKTAFAIGRPLGSEASTVLARNFLDAIILFPLCVQSRFVLGESYPLAAKRVIRHLPDSNVTVRLDRIPQKAGGAVVDGSLSALSRVPYAIALHRSQSQSTQTRGLVLASRFCRG